MIVGLDLGSAEVGMSVDSKRVVLREPSSMALETRTGRVVAIGAAAERMRGRTGSSIEVVRPLQAGLAASPQLVALMVRHLLQRGLGWRRWLRPTLQLSVPITTTDLEKEALRAALMTAGAGPVRLVLTPVAAGRGAGFDVAAPRGCLVVDIGASHTQAGVVFLDSLVASEAILVGGDAMDSAIVRHVRLQYGVEIDESQAEKLKIDVGSVAPGEMREEKVTGRDARSGLPVETTLSSVDVSHALQDALQQIEALISKVLVALPPELAGDVMDRGILLTGGGARLRGLAASLESRFHVPVHVAPRPEVCAVLGSSVPDKGELL